MHAKLNILLQSRNIVYQYFTTCNKFSHISLLFVSKKLFHNNTKITYFDCWRTWHGGHRPTNDGTKPNNKQRKPTNNQRKAKNAKQSKLSRTRVSAPRPPCDNFRLHLVGCWRTWHGGHRPTIVCNVVINPSLARPFTPLSYGEGKAAKAARGRGFCLGGRRFCIFIHYCPHFQKGIKSQSESMGFRL